MRQLGGGAVSCLPLCGKALAERVETALQPALPSHAFLRSRSLYPWWYAWARLPAGSALALLQCQCGANEGLKCDSAYWGSDLFVELWRREDWSVNLSSKWNHRHVLSGSLKDGTACWHGKIVRWQQFSTHFTYTALQMLPEHKCFCKK